MMRRLKTLILGSTLSLAFLTGCEQLEYFPNAAGELAMITVITDSTTWAGEVGDAIRTHVAPYLGTLPAPERMFEIEQYDLLSPSLFERIKVRRNILIVAPLSDSTAVAGFLRDRLDDNALQAVAGGQTAVIGRTDLWARPQRVIYLVAQEKEDLVSLIADRADDIQYTYNEAIREWTAADMFERLQQTDKEDALLDDHAFAVNIQHDYQTVVDTIGLVYMRRVLSDTWRNLVVYYEENANPEDLTPEWVYQTRDRITKEHMRGNVHGWVAIDYRRPLEAENINFLGHYGFEVRGLWHMEGPDPSGRLIPLGMGGPFVSYAFYDETSSRLYLIDGMVFAPNYKKREFLRQMEAIAYSFRRPSPEGVS